LGDTQSASSKCSNGGDVVNLITIVLQTMKAIKTAETKDKGFAAVMKAACRLIMRK
jgi:hypothetical protein